MVGFFWLFSGTTATEQQEPKCWTAEKNLTAPLMETANKQTSYTKQP